MATFEDDGDVPMPDASPPPQDDNDSAGSDTSATSLRCCDWSDMNIPDDDGDIISIDRNTCPPDLEFEDAISFCFRTFPDAVSNEHVLSLNRGTIMTEHMLHEVALDLTRDTPAYAIPDSLVAQFAQGQRQIHLLRRLASYFKHSGPGHSKSVYITNAMDFQARVLASCYVGPTRPLSERLLGISLNEVQIKCLWSYLGPDAEALYQKFKKASDNLSVDVDMIDAGNSIHGGDDSNDGSYRGSHEKPKVLRRNPNKGKHSDDLVKKPYHELFPETQEKYLRFGVRDSVTTDNNSETDESELELPLPEFRDLLDDWYSANAADNYDDDSEAEEAIQVDTNHGEACQKFNLQKLLDRVATMDPDDSHSDTVINGALRTNETENLRITFQHKESIFSGLPNNQTSSESSAGLSNWIATPG
ncbi:hypothetical protein FBEOM_8894 [Fusarium beomiforme]|uniref:Uncharacterized protein n=1 Tax=Fusarium beomiforme TaxID=44412 RepID=A0A9P5DU20_9HYPO|nr:hypothetical protein FBEOM_8894 [Fusarium beomiforme]